jgi:hypothetical protein
MLDLAAPPGTRVSGYTTESGLGPFPPVYLGEWHCQECGRRHEFETCPLCGSWIDFGYGLMGGGFGRYAYCTGHACDWFYKWHDPEETDRG